MILLFCDPCEFNNDRTKSGRNRKQPRPDHNMKTKLLKLGFRLSTTSSYEICRILRSKKIISTPKAEETTGIFFGVLEVLCISYLLILVIILEYSKKEERGHSD
jgi:hypothetical protein